MRAATSLLLCVLFIAGGCSDGGGGRSEAPQSTTVAMRTPPASEAAGAALTPGAAQAVPERKIISTVVLDVVVTDFSGVQENIEQLVRQHPGAYVAESAFTGTRGQSRSGRWTLRVPQASYDTVTSALRRLGEVSQENKQSQEVTEEFVDLSARIKSKRETEQRLLKIQADRTVSLDQVLVAEREVARVREEVERMEGRLNRLDDLVSLTTIRLSVSELRTLQAGEIAFQDRISGAWSASFGQLRRLGQATLVFIVTLAPWLPLLLAAAFGARMIVRRAARPKPLTIRG